MTPQAETPAGRARGGGGVRREPQSEVIIALAALSIIVVLFPGIGAAVRAGAAIIY